MVNCGAREIATAIRARFPSQIVIEVPENTTLMQARLTGMERSTRNHVAVLNERYSVSEQWLAALLEEHAGVKADIVSGVVAAPASLSTVEWAMYLTEYSASAPPVPREVATLPEAAALPTGNVRYAKQILETANIKGATTDLDLHSSLFRAGARFMRDNRMQVEFACPNTLEEYLAERRQVSYDFARHRARRMSPPARVFAAVLRLGLPPWFLLRTSRQVWRKSPLRARFWRALPWMVRFSFIQMAAEMRGFLSSTPD